MYLLHIREDYSAAKCVSTLAIKLENHVGEIPPYAILSHRWGAPREEVTFQDLIGDGDHSAAKRKAGYQKLEQFCLQTLEYGLTYGWVDTCCIDKSSSAELSEAINSMYAWYGEAQICFAYLDDVPSDQDVRAPDSAFRRSNWFTRGWTLQELIAPTHLFFFAGDWNPRPLGDRSSLADVVSDITKIPVKVLLNRANISMVSIAQKMSWASTRQTTRVEDEAYCLMGILGVSMATIYGEGRRAFIRLQEELMRYSSDHTIFAWDAAAGSVEEHSMGMLATSPRCFVNSAEYMPVEPVKFARLLELHKDQPDNAKSDFQLTYTMTNFGLQIQLPIYRISENLLDDYHIAVLACRHGRAQYPTVLFLRRNHTHPDDHFYRTTFNGFTTFYSPQVAELVSRGASARWLWISTPRLQRGPQMPSPTVQPYVTRLHCHFESNRPGRWPALTHSFAKSSDHRIEWTASQSVVFDLEQGEHAVVGAMCVPKYRIEAVQHYIICVIGLLNGRAWYQIHGPFHLGEPPPPKEECGLIIDNHASIFLPSYDLLQPSNLWHRADWTPTIVDVDAPSQQRKLELESPRTVVKVNERRTVNGSGKIEVYLRLWVEEPDL
ncbi:hypothetical protein OQA88_2285 [Cercophora sp. LCS_1]